MYVVQMRYAACSITLPLVHARSASRVTRPPSRVASGCPAVAEASKTAPISTCACQVSVRLGAKTITVVPRANAVARAFAPKFATVIVTACQASFALTATANLAAPRTLDATPTRFASITSAGKYLSKLNLIISI